MIRELFECYWPTVGVSAWHTVWGLQQCLTDDDLPLIHSHGRTPIASGWSGDIICVSLDDRLDISIASHDLLYSSEGVKGKRGLKIYRSLDIDLGEYLRKLTRIEATIRFVDGMLQYAPAAEDVVHADYYDAVQAHKSKSE